MQTPPLLKIEGLKTWFETGGAPVRAVDGVSMSIGRGSAAALVGESGCGKSVTALSLARLVARPPGCYAGGRVLFEGRDVLRMGARSLRRLRGGGIAYVFQEPAKALNPVVRVGRQVAEAARMHSAAGGDARAESLRLMSRVGLPEPQHLFSAYPHELSGGMQQRVVIAMALACRPRLLVADEPTTALDVTIQAQILDLLDSVRREFGMAVLLITHNLGLVADFADRLHVMYAGLIVEAGPVEQVLRRPAHPYTRGLLGAVPRLDRGSADVKGIPGSVPDPTTRLLGCRFAPRCAHAEDACRASEPGPVQVGEDWQASCRRALDPSLPGRAATGDPR